MQNQQHSLSMEYCEVFQRLLTQQFILNIWKAFRESGNISEGKVTKGAFVKEMFKQLKTYVKGKEYSYISAQFFKVLAPEEYLQYTEKVRDEFRDTLKKKCEEAKARGDAVQSKLLDSAFDQWFKQHFDSPFDKWFKQNFECSMEKMFKTTFESLNEKWLKTNNIHIIFDSGRFEKWVQAKFEVLFDKLFERFSLEGDEKIEIQDIAISLAVLARLELDPKLDLIFQLSDVDEDGCLSIDDISQMICRIEKNFTRETSLITSDSQALQVELAFRRSKRKFTWATLKMDKQMDIKNDELGLIEGKHFLKSLKENQNLYENFLPQQMLLYDVLLTDQSERDYSAEDSVAKGEETAGPVEKVTFDGFRKEMHATLRNNFKDKFSKEYLAENRGQVRYPGKVEVTQVGTTVKKIPKLEKFEEKREQKKEKEEYAQQVSKTNTIEIHHKRLKDMQEYGVTLKIMRNE